MQYIHNIIHQFFLPTRVLGIKVYRVVCITRNSGLCSVMGVCLSLHQEHTIKIGLASSLAISSWLVTFVI